MPYSTLLTATLVLLSLSGHSEAPSLVPGGRAPDGIHEVWAVPASDGVALELRRSGKQVAQPLFNEADGVLSSLWQTHTVATVLYRGSVSWNSHSDFLSVSLPWGRYENETYLFALDPAGRLTSVPLPDWCAVLAASLPDTKGLKPSCSTSAMSWHDNDLTITVLAVWGQPEERYPTHQVTFLITLRCSHAKPGKTPQVTVLGTKRAA